VPPVGCGEIKLYKNPTDFFYVSLSLFYTILNKTYRGKLTPTPPMFIEITILSLYIPLHLGQIYLPFYQTTKTN